MSAKGLEVIEHAAQTTHEWVNELAGRLDYASKPSALRLMRTVNCQTGSCAPDL